MKTSTITRFVLATLCTTLVCIGLSFGVIGISGFLIGSWYYFIQRSELTKPIPMVSVAYGILLAGGVALGILYDRRPENVFRTVFAMVTWIVMMICIYYEWQRAKKVLPDAALESTALSAGSSAAACDDSPRRSSASGRADGRI